MNGHLFLAALIIQQSLIPASVNMLRYDARWFSDYVLSSDRRSFSIKLRNRRKAESGAPHGMKLGFIGPTLLVPKLVRRAVRVTGIIERERHCKFSWHITFHCMEPTRQPTNSLRAERELTQGEWRTHPLGLPSPLPPPHVLIGTGTDVSGNGTKISNKISKLLTV